MKSGLNWWDVIFSDESMIELRPTRRILIRRPPNLGFHPLFTPKLKKVPAKKGSSGDVPARMVKG